MCLFALQQEPVSWCVSQKCDEDSTCGQQQRCFPVFSLCCLPCWVVKAAAAFGKLSWKQHNRKKHSKERDVLEINLERFFKRWKQKNTGQAGKNHTEPENICVKAENLMEECMMKICGQVDRYCYFPVCSCTFDPLHKDTTAQLHNIV